MAFSFLEAEAREYAPVEPNPSADIVISAIARSFAESSLNTSGDIENRASPQIT